MKMEYSKFMKTRGVFHLVFSRRIFLTGHPLSVGIWAIVLASLCGCASRNQTGGPQQHTTPSMAGLVRMEMGTIGVTCASEPAATGYDEPEGRTGYAGDGAGYAARACLTPPFPSEPGLDAVYSPVGLVLAPFGAAYGAVATSRQKLSPDRVSESKSDLAGIMSDMADQTCLRDRVLEVGGELTRHRLVLLDANESSAAQRDKVNSVLETRVEQLRLERKGSKDTSFVLHIKARARLVRMPDRKVLFEQPFEYQSEKALFLDWTYPSAFRGVAETAYRELAAQIAERVFASASEKPLLAGAGYKRFPDHAPHSATRFARDGGLTSRPGLIRVSLVDSDSGSLGVYTTPTLMSVSVQHPLTKDEAVSEAVSETVWALDGLEDSRNLVVQLSASAVAVPLGLWKQTVGLFSGVGEKKLRAADAQLTAASHQARPQFELANQVAQELASRSSHPALLAKTSDRGTAGSERPTPIREAVAFRPDQGTATALEIQVVSAALQGRQGPNPPLALCVEARGTLVRVVDGTELYSCPVCYRSEQRKFTKWAADDARLFRQELERCYHEVSVTIADQLEAQGLIPPDRSKQPTLAKQ